MNETAIRLLVDDLVSAWNDRDIDRFISHFDESVIWDDCAMLLGPAIGRSAVREFSENTLRAFPDFSIRIREPICIAQSGSRFVIPWEITATHTGYFYPLGLAPTHQVVKMLGVDVVDIKDMKITRIETYFNVMPALEQALRLKPLAKSRISQVIIVWIQRCWAYWLRRTTKVKK